MTRAVIIGGTGFIGRWLANALHRRGLEILIVDRLKPAGGMPWAEADARDAGQTLKFVKKGDLVVHLVHSSIPVESMDDPTAELRENVIPYVELIDGLADAQAGLLAFCSSGGQVYGESEKIPIPESAARNPISGYGASKLAMEEFTRLLSRRRGLAHIIMRMGNPYGPFQELTNRHGVIPYLLRAAIKKKPFTVFGGGVTVRDYIYIGDAAEAMAGLITGGAQNVTVNIGSGEGASLSDIISVVEKVTGEKIETIEKPIRSSDVQTNVLDISLLKKITGFTPPTRLEEGIKKTWEYFPKK